MESAEGEILRKRGKNQLPPKRDARIIVAGNKMESMEGKILRKSGKNQLPPKRVKGVVKGALEFWKCLTSLKQSEKADMTEPSVKELEEGPLLPNDEDLKAKNQVLLMWGGLGLTEPPKEEEWLKAKEIQLMDNKLSVLPARPMCPILSELYLQRNYKLRKIPSSFFENMPALQVLNLSKTGIMSLPESLFRLVGLKRLFLNGCDNFMMLSPKVGELKRLEVLDLEGTDIIDLPKEIEKLTNLTCLKVSFYGYKNHGRKNEQPNTMIHGGVISTLSQLEELNIDVNPDDERWGVSVEAIVEEVCSLKRLNTLRFYFPRVELLRPIHWYILPGAHPLSHFKLIVGCHLKRVISRLPRDVEFELERWDRCLKYINGTGVPMEIKRALSHATAFYLDRHMTVKKLSEFGIENMMYLKCCILGECNEIQVIIDEEDVHEADYDREIVSESDYDREIFSVSDYGTEIVSESSYHHRRIGLESLEYLNIYYMKNLTSICKGPVNKWPFSLKSLTLHTCPKLTTIFTLSLLANLCSLEELTVEDCPSIKSLVSCENRSKHEASSLAWEYFLPKLKTISLHYVPELVTISSDVCIAPKLEWLSLYNCPNLKSLSIKEVSSTHLKRIMGEMDWWEALERRNDRPDNLDGIFVPINSDDLINEMDSLFLSPSQALKHKRTQRQGKEKERMGGAGNKKESMGEKMKKGKSPARGNIKIGQEKERVGSAGSTKERMREEMKKDKPPMRAVKLDVKSNKGEQSLSSNNRQFKYSEVVKITNKFQTLIGRGGFGTVYLGYWNELQVAVKMLSPSSSQGSEQFWNEIQLLRKVHHRNLISLVGYCNEGTDIGLIYEYMTNGSLRECLSGKTKTALSWEQRLQIAVDVAQGLNYLHHSCEPPIVHRDPNSGNILLNENLRAKISDFGLSRSFPLEESHLDTTIAGTIGYVDPEYYSSGRLTKKSDVYVFGVVLLELITGQSAIIKSEEGNHIINWVSPIFEKADISSIIDPRLQGNFDGDSVWKAMQTAMVCTASVSIDRPTMTRVLIELKECLEREIARDQIELTECLDMEARDQSWSPPQGR